jgi:hypothetical protein
MANPGGGDLRHQSWQEADIKAGLRDGGAVVGVFVVARAEPRGAGFAAYIRTDWARGFRPLRTFRDRSDRIFRSLDKLVGLLRDDFHYSGEITLFVAGDESLRRFRALLPADLAALDSKSGISTRSGSSIRARTDKA